MARIIMLGDVVGEPGLLVLEKHLGALIDRYKADITVVNGENAAEGFGLTAQALDRILDAGADAVTSGNHIWEKRDFWPVLDSDKPVLRPANYPRIPAADGSKATPGRLWRRLEKNGFSAVIINLQGRELMTAIECPFRCFDSIFAEHFSNGISADGIFADALIVDFHAEAAAEKEALAYYLDGRASIVAGTHTHVQTADERILPKGTAYITDLGMTGAKNGIIGMDTAICLNRARNQVTYRMECARITGESDCTIQGIAAELDSSGRALHIERINLHG